MQTSRSETAGKTQLTYVFDAYCGWCFGFGPALTEFVRQNADSIDLSVVSGGLFTGERVAPMSSAPYLKSANATIAAQTGAVFGDGYSQLVTDGRFVMDSTDAAIGLAALRAQDPTRALDIAEAMQITFYRDGRSLSDPETYRSIAESLQLDPSAAVSSLFTAASKDAARADFVRARRLGATSFPTLLFHGSDGSVVKFGSPTSTAADLTRDLNTCVRAYAVA